MVVSLSFLFAVVFCFASIVVHSFGKLVVLRHPLASDKQTRNLTCMSEDDNAALIWNYNSDSDGTFIKGFEPNVSTSKTIPYCAILDWLSGCLIEWEKTNDWDMVNSTMKPMGPVFDQRWEELKDYVYDESLRKVVYHYVEKVNGSSGAVVFSARGLRDVHVFICEKKAPRDGRCISIKIPSSAGGKSVLKSCAHGLDMSSERLDYKNCDSIAEVKTENTNIALLEWDTFIAKWNNEEETIEIFKANNSKPFLSGKTSLWHNEAHISVFEDHADSHIRFHFYGYFMTAKNNAVIFVKEFEYSHRFFCVDLLLGLCPECKLNVSLTDVSSLTGRKGPLKTWTISDVEGATYNGLLTWRSVRLSHTFDDADTRVLILRIQTILDKDKGTGQWAIDKFRTCRSVDKIRTSTVLHHRTMSSEPAIKCQKLSYNKSELVDPRDNTTYRDSDTLEPFIREYRRQYKEDYNIFGRKYFICDSMGCSCNRGFTGDDCGTVCSGELYGYNCAEKCKNCEGKHCSGTTGYCTQGCTRKELIPPVCKTELEAPNVINITDTAAKITQTVEVGRDVEISVSFMLTMVKSNISSLLSTPHKTAVGYEYDLQDLESNADYKVHTMVTILETNLHTTMNASETFFTTCERKPRPEGSSGQRNLLHLAWLIILPIIGMCLFLLFRLRRRALLRKDCQDDISLTIVGTGTPAPPPNETTENPIYESVPGVVQTNLYSNSVKIEDFEEYAKEAMASGLLNAQHEVFPKGPTKPCKYGKLTKNLNKNRFPNIVPYDESRVVLKKLPGESASDYINASYIQGYRKSRAYIATQGPDSNTVKDFWRMVWQEKVRVICMVANVVESGKAACVQYWPDIGNKTKHGDIHISNTNHQVFTDYTIRTFSLSRNNEWRGVVQLHYTGWPDDGVPMHTQSLVAYVKKLLAIPAGKGPVVVHCHAGVGRTGTIILCDICLRQAVRERVIDVPAVCIKLFEDRVNFMENVQLYLLAHLTVMEAMITEQTQIPCDSSLPDKIKELRNQLPSDVERLKGTVWQDRALHSLAVERTSILNNGTSHRPYSSESLPASPVLPHFHRDSTFVSESNYINAVSVDGVMARKQYLESQLPSHSTLSEYWRLIAEKRIELVVILQPPNPKDSTQCAVMPTDSTLRPVPYIKVRRKSRLEEEEHFTTEKLLMKDKSGKSRQQQVTVITCTGWKCGEGGKPPPPAALVAIWRATERIKRKVGPTLVLCRDGVTGCGLYLAMSFLLERMSVETECDVISAVRAVRRSRTDFVQSMEQFEYLYDAALNYYECFQTYANFS